MFRSDPETAAKLSRTGQSLVTLEQAVAVSTQIGAECYVETKALVSSLETLEVDRLVSLAKQYLQNAYLWICRCFDT